MNLIAACLIILSIGTASSGIISAINANTEVVKMCHERR